VARFTGLAGELRVRVRDRGANGTVLVEPCAGRAFLATAPTLPLAGEAALVMIRPAVMCSPRTSNFTAPNGPGFPPG
jgi:hypothetical protein